MIYCMKCGNKLPEEAKFCKYCGFSTGLSEETEDNIVEIETSPIVEAEPIHISRVEVEIKTSPNVEVEIKTSPKLEVEIKSTPVVESVVVPAPAPIVAPIPAPVVIPAPIPVVVPAPIPVAAPAPIVAAAVTPPRVEAEIIAPDIKYSSITEVQPRYPRSVEDEIIYPQTAVEAIPRYPHRDETENRYPRRTENETEIRHPFNAEVEKNEHFSHSVKSQNINPFEKNHQKPGGYYIDNEFHGGLARKNIGGTYNQTRDCVEGGKWGFVDTTRREVIPVIYDTVSEFKDGLAKVSLNGRFGLLNKKGTETIPLVYNDVSFTSEGMTGACINGKWGFIDSKGKKVIPFKYSNVTPFENGMAGVCKNGKWGMIDKNDRIMVSFMYNDASQFENYKKSNTKNLADRPDKMNGLMYRFTIGIIKAWAALFGEAIFLFIISRLLPPEKNNFYWMLVGVTIVISFLLFYLIIDTIKGAARKRMDQ